MPGSTLREQAGASTRAPVDLDDADAADVDRRQGVGVAQRRGVDAELRAAASRIVEPAGTLTRRAVDRELDDAGSRARAAACGMRLGRAGGSR